MKKTIVTLLLTATLLLSAAGCGAPAASQSSDPADAVTSASVDFYQSSSLDQPQLMEAVAGAEGSCTIATVNEDGTPNLIVAVPAAAGDSHLAFTWQDNNTKANLKRGSTVEIAYYIYDKDAPDKDQRHRGARIKGHLEADQAVVDKLLANDATLPPICTFIAIDEVLPLG